MYCITKCKCTLQGSYRSNDFIQKRMNPRTYYQWLFQVGSKRGPLLTSKVLVYTDYTISTALSSRTRLLLAVSDFSLFSLLSLRLQHFCWRFWPWESFLWDFHSSMPFHMNDDASVHIKILFNRSLTTTRFTNLKLVFSGSNNEKSIRPLFAISNFDQTK